MNQMLSQPPEIGAHSNGLPIGSVFAKIMAQHPFPIGLAGVVQRMPVPVFHHIRPAGQMRKGQQTKLSVVGRPLGEALGLGLQHKIIILLQGSGQVPAKRCLRSRQSILGGMVNITSGNIQTFRRLKMIHIRLYPVRAVLPPEIKVVGNKLIFPFVLSDQSCLPSQEVRHQPSLKPLKFSSQTSVDGASHIREILPGVHRIAPVVQPELPVHLLHISMKLFLQINYKIPLHVFTGRAKMLGLIVNLIPYNRRMVLHMLHEPADHPLAVEKVSLIGDVHDLPGPVDPPASLSGHQNIRIPLCHPGGHSIGGRSHNHMYTGISHGIQHTVNMVKVKHTVLRLQSAPGGFRDSHQIHIGLFQHFHIFFQALKGHIFIIIRRTIQQFFHIASSHLSTVSRIPPHRQQYGSPSGVLSFAVHNNSIFSDSREKSNPKIRAFTP